jgi:hypothetical protein
MHGAICYDVQTLEMLCEWVDLSPEGDGSQRRYFNSAVDIHTFLNHRPPQVQVVVDASLTPTAHTILAKVYESLGHQSSVFSRPPNIEITNRRTLLTFIAEAETGLSAIAYLATWPFRDGEAIQTTLIQLITQGLEQPNRSWAQDESHRQLHTVIETLRQQDLGHLSQLFVNQPFFTAPLQLKLTNAAGHSLELYHNPRFGIRHLPPSDSIFPVQPAYLPSPQVEDYLAFLSPAGDERAL